MNSVAKRAAVQDSPSPNTALSEPTTVVPEVSPGTPVQIFPHKWVPGWGGDFDDDGTWLHGRDLEPEAAEDPAVQKAAEDPAVQKKKPPYDAPVQPYRELKDVLTQKFPTDAHFTPYCIKVDGIPIAAPRVRQECLAKLPSGMEIHYGCLVVDPDDPVAHKLKIPARQEWYDDLRPKMASLPATLRSGMAWYYTRGGIRILWLLKPTIVGPQQYISLLKAVRLELSKHGILVDALVDWTRCYRVPHARRDGVVLDLPYDYSNLGPLVWCPEDGIEPSYADPRSGKVTVGKGGAGSLMGSPQEPVSYRQPKSAETATGEGKWDLTEVRTPLVLPPVIDAGTRNDLLFRRACGLRGKNTPPDGILKILRIINHQKCDPPVDDDELHRIVDSACKYPAGNTPAPLPILDTTPLVRPAQSPSLSKTGLPASLTQKASPVTPVSSAAVVRESPSPGATKASAGVSQPASAQAASNAAVALAPDAAVVLESAPVAAPPVASPAPVAPPDPVPPPATAPLLTAEAVVQARRLAALKAFNPEGAPQEAGQTLARRTGGSLTPEQERELLADPNVLADSQTDEDFVRLLPSQAAANEDLLYDAAILKRVAILYRTREALFNRLTKELKLLGANVTDWRRSVTRAAHALQNKQQADDANHAPFQRADNVELALTALTEMRLLADGTLSPELAYDRNQLWQYTKDLGIWQPLGYGTFERVIHSYAGAPVIVGRDAKGAERLGEVKISAHLAADAKEIAKMHTAGKETGFFDTPYEGITFSNKFVLVTKDGIEAVVHSEHQRSTSRLNFEYPEQYVEPTKFLAAMQAWFEVEGGLDDETRLLREKDRDDKIQLLREMVGIFMINKGPEYQQGLILLGDGSNGKSTFMEIVSSLFVGNLMSHVTPHDMDNEYRRAMLADARINLVAELPGREIINTDAVKAAITGDPQTARHIREAPFTFRCKAGQIYNTNDMPIVRDMSAGWWRRWKIVTFNRNFAMEDAPNSGLVDSATGTLPKAKLNLSKEIIEEERSAIAAWFLEGALNALRRGCYINPKSSIEALKGWREGLDQVNEYVDMKCARVDIFDANKKYISNTGTSATLLYSNYAAWASQSGHKLMSDQTFWKRLTGLKVDKHRTENGFIYGLKILSTSPLGGLHR